MNTKGQRAKEEIVNAALDIASVDGLEGLTLGTLAKHLGRSKSGLFSHFATKEALQLTILDTAHHMFARDVVDPALKNPRGLPRLNALVDQWVGWAERLPGGCIFITAAIEYDDRPGPVRDLVVEGQREWLSTIGRAVQQAIDEGHLSDEAAPEQFAFEVQSILLGCYWNFRLLHDKKALSRAKRALSRLIESYRTAAPPPVVKVAGPPAAKLRKSASAASTAAAGPAARPTKAAKKKRKARVKNPFRR